MRITNRVILERSLASVQKGLGDMARFERQIATGLRLERVSDDPVAGRTVLEADSDLGRLDQLGRNIQAARSGLVVEDATLQAVTGLLSRARELGIAQASDPANADTRATAALEVTELLRAAVQAGNQTLAGRYVFGGAYSDRPPLDPSGALDPTRPARGSPAYEIGPGQTMPGAHDAGQVFIDSDVIGAMEALRDALDTDDRAAIETATDRVRTAITSVQELVAEVGAREARLDVADEARSTLEATVRERRSALADASLEEAITRLAATQSSYQATLLSTSRILDTTLTNYLR